MDHTVKPDAVRPARDDGTCFYCHTPVGGQHDAKCVLRTKRVRVVVTIEIEREYPEHWDDHMIEFHGNESSSCADNIIRDIVAEMERRDAATEGPMCMCGCVSLEVAPTPERRTAGEADHGK